MRFGFRATVVAVLSPLVVIACLGGDNQCLNPQPDLPSCRSYNGSGSSIGGSFNGAPGGAGAPSPVPPGGPTASGGASAVGGFGASAPVEEIAGSSGESAGAGGDSSSESGADAGAGGAAGNDDRP